MKKIFLAFSIVLGFSFSWAESVNPGTDSNEAVTPQGAGSSALGVNGASCANCAKNVKQNIRLYDNTNPDAKSTGSSGGGTTPRGDAATQ